MLVSDFALDCCCSCMLANLCQGSLPWPRVSNDSLAEPYSSYHQNKYPDVDNSKGSAKVQPALTADFEDMSFGPYVEVGGQFMPLENMGVAPSTHVSVLHINTP
ncbi:hypothetical protein SLEP1_g24762 [Rubroshorea leprosula]|uniref:Uncharacterized protein n=1 Tax=Rubroshorea leprosula TaxID=152421 RepID=A0AAV5JMW1_9ROSI|nr:hypothetical protein SLEP1_g24762 [Rubroshorea leprosula]